MLGIVADDLTGALDAALLLHAEGIATPVVVGVDAFLRSFIRPPTLILDVDSRGDQPAEAYRKVRQAVAVLRDAGYTRFYKKMSSTFQGHIGPEVDAMMDEAGAVIAPVVPAFPANGRTTLMGFHYIDGVPLAETGVGRHPTSPITDSYLPRVLAGQTRRKVGLIDFNLVRQGSEALRVEFQRRQGVEGMVLVDVTSEEELATIADAARGMLVSSGGSALAGKLPGPEEREGVAPPEIPERRLPGCLILAGSVSPVTSRQVAAALSGGVPGFRLDVLALLEPGGCPDEVARACRFALERLGGGDDAMVYTPSDPETVAKAKARGRELGIGHLEAGLAIARCMSEVGEAVVSQSGLNRLVVAGGDTSSTVCQRLGLEIHHVLSEIETGVPLSLSEGRRTLVTVWKSGNFGSEGFFARALEIIRQ